MKVFNFNTEEVNVVRNSLKDSYDTFTDRYHKATTDYDRDFYKRKLGILIKLLDEMGYTEE